MQFETDQKRADFIQTHIPLARTILFKTIRHGRCGHYDINDLEQEAYLALIRAVDKYDSNSNIKFSTYAWAVIRNRLIDIIRHARVQKEIEVTVDETHIESFGKRNDVDDIKPDIDGLLSILSDEDRRLFVEHTFNGKTYRELSATMGIHYSTVKRRYDKICDVLRKNYNL